ncbi:glutathione peroxidase [Shimia isoporae]|uniref:Glutathione peroxidase n=1 Tax=Shimia isoporae TaxID=647720 RepID=A0A4V2Q1W8_9RHOB|nr:glutathione peroxidase [Shimia isoporae]TCK99752.1 glutathione peroxidase [Shimia isoporae]
MKYLIALIAVMSLARTADALDLSATFESIDGGEIAVSDWAGQPVLVVNTASQCAFTKQYRGLQDLYDAYRDQGLVVLAVPSDDFKQELRSNAEVKEFCELQYGIDMPMTGITSVKGKTAHPLFASLREEENYVPRWNFSKVLIGPEGTVVATYSSKTEPMSNKIVGQIEALLD